MTTNSFIGSRPEMPRHDADRRSDRDQLCLIRHLAFAAETLACDGINTRRSIFQAATARLRDMAAGSPRRALGPVVPLPGRPGIALVDLLGYAWEVTRGSLPNQGFDAELVEAARQLLCDLAWQLPDEVHRPILDRGPFAG